MPAAQPPDLGPHRGQEPVVDPGRVEAVQGLAGHVLLHQQHVAVLGRVAATTGGVRTPARAASSDRYASCSTACRYSNHGQRVVAGQRLMQAASDIFLGWDRGAGIDGQDRDFYLRQLRDWKASVEVEAMRPKAMAAYAHMCGWTLARAHARSGDRVAIASYLGKGDVFDRAMAAFAEVYADQNERDYQALRDAVKAGTVEARTGL